MQTYSVFLELRISLEAKKGYVDPLAVCVNRDEQFSKRESPLCIEHGEPFRCSTRSVRAHAQSTSDASPSHSPESRLALESACLFVCVSREKRPSLAHVTTAGGAVYNSNFFTLFYG